MPMTTSPPKIYTIRDIPRSGDMADYLTRIKAVSGRLAKPSSVPDLPSDMGYLTFEEANDIERALLGTEQMINAMEKSFVYSGETESGGF